MFFWTRGCCVNIKIMKASDLTMNILAAARCVGLSAVAAGTLNRVSAARDVQ